MINTLIGAAFLLSTISLTLGLARSISWLNKSDNPASRANNTNRIAILIPVYREDKIIEQTFSRFSKLINKDVDLFFVTTSREGGQNNKTLRILKNLINKTNIHILRYNGPGFKGGQLNYAMHKLSGHYDYYAIFDADSSPDPCAFNFVKTYNNKYDILQMPSIYTDNIANISKIERASAIMQCTWTLSYEIPHWLNYQKAYSGLVYVVGRGLFINAKSNLLFSETSLGEDLELGYYASINHRYIKVIPFFDYCTVPATFRENIKQTARWYTVELALPKVLMHCKAPCKYFSLAMARYYWVLTWLLGPIIIIISLAASILTMNFIATVIHTLALIIYCYILPRLSGKVINPLEGQYKLTTYIIRAALNNLGPLLCVIRTLAHRNREFIKTDR